MKRDMHRLSCPFGHQGEWVEIARMNPVMSPMSDVYTDTPNPQAVKWSVWVMPRVRELIEARFQGRLWTTLATLFDCLADDQVIILQGSEVKELKKRGLSNGSQIVAALDAYKQMERERDQAVEQLERMQAVLSSAGLT